MAFDHSSGPNCLAFITYVLNQRLFLCMLVSSNNSVLMALDWRALAALCLLRESSLPLQSRVLFSQVTGSGRTSAVVTGTRAEQRRHPSAPSPGGARDTSLSLSFDGIFLIIPTCV